MCIENTYYYPSCSHKDTVMEQCDHKRQSSESCFYSCFGSGSCEDVVARSRYSKSPCSECSMLRKRAAEEREKREIRARATHAANNYGWTDRTAGARDSYIEPALGHAMAGLHGNAVYKSRRCAPASSHQQGTNNNPATATRAQASYYQQGRGDNNWPVARTQPQKVDQSAGRAQPVRSLPPIQVKQANQAHKPKMDYHSIPQPMTAEVVRIQSTRAPRPVQIRTQAMTNIHRPQVVAHHVVHPDMKRPVRRDSNGVSEFGSDEGDSPGWRNQAISPRTISPLNEGYTYQAW
ncbi:hypothetical protein BJ170DRAFT_710503 [Xylariales sp. AK1849]|nr:hypothetical protein BJ170DRAFT_710503 [Xylariales sp. AK1849]